MLNENHYIDVNYRQRVTRKEAQSILINHQTVICRGRIYSLKAINVGAGVYEIRKEKI